MVAHVSNCVHPLLGADHHSPLDVLCKEEGKGAIAGASFAVRLDCLVPGHDAGDE